MPRSVSADLDGKCVDTVFEFFGQGLVDGPVLGDTVHAFEGLRGNLNPEMSFAAFTPAAMAPVLLGFVDYIQGFRCKGAGQLGGDRVFGAHAVQRVVRV